MLEKYVTCDCMSILVNKFDDDGIEIDDLLKVCVAIGKAHCEQAEGEHKVTLDSEQGRGKA